MATERIQKVLAAAGYGARRTCELLVLDGRVKVNGRTVRTLPVIVDPAKDKITVGGRIIHPEKVVYYLLNKPRGVYCTHKDPADRRLAVDLLVGVREHVFPIGRLDADSMGLLIMTNDGVLTQKLTHPKYGIPKTYRVQVDGHPTTATLQKLRGGVWLSEGKTAPAIISVIHKQRDKVILEITLREGRNREIRRMLLKAGCKVRRLNRIKMGKLSIRKLSVGAFRRLTAAEVKYLQSLANRASSVERVPSERHKPRRAKRAPAAPGKETPATSRRSRPAKRAGTSAPKPKTAVKKASDKTVSKKKQAKARKPTSRRRILRPDA